MEERRTRQAARVGALARAWARLLGARWERHGDLHVAWGLPRWAYPRGGVTLGDTYLTGSRPAARSPARLRHELVHVAQWRRYGYSFAWRYPLAGWRGTRNRYEIEAGLADGGYVPHRRPPESPGTGRLGA